MDEENIETSMFGRSDPWKNTFLGEFQVIAAIPIGKNFSNQEIDALRNYHNLEFLKILFATYDPVAAPYVPNRHGIAHGLDTDYPTEERSARLFLLLDMLHEMLEGLTP